MDWNNISIKYRKPKTRRWDAYEKKKKKSNTAVALSLCLAEYSLTSNRKGWEENFTSFSTTEIWYRFPQKLLFFVTSPRQKMKLESCKCLLSSDAGRGGLNSAYKWRTWNQLQWSDWSDQPTAVLVAWQQNAGQKEGQFLAHSVE